MGATEIIANKIKQMTNRELFSIAGACMVELNNRIQQGKIEGV
jgi:hypothetical protein